MVISYLEPANDEEIFCIVFYNGEEKKIKDNFMNLAQLIIYLSCEKNGDVWVQTEHVNTDVSVTDSKTGYKLLTYLYSIGMQISVVDLAYLDV